MAVYNGWVVEYYNGSAWTTLSNVRELSCNVGRKFPSEPWPVSSASLTVWYPTGFAAPIPSLVVGAKIRFFAPGRSSSHPSWTGLISNLRLELGQIWNSSTSYGAEDFLIIECEGEGSRVARLGQIINVLEETDVEAFIEDTIGVPNSLVTKAQGTFGRFDDLELPGGVYNLWDAMQQVAVYTVGRILDGVRKKSTGWAGTAGVTNDPAVVFYNGRFSAADVASVKFSDTTNNSTYRKFDQYQFDSVADNFFTSSEIDGKFGGSTDTYRATATGASAPFRQFNASAIGLTADLLQEVAGFWANSLSSNSVSPIMISATASSQQTQNLDTLGFADLELAYLTTKGVELSFRGVSYLCRIEGVSVFADVQDSRFTYYVSPTTDTAWFILDDATLGVLDQNRLGLY